jgi:hypothetical protein
MYSYNLLLETSVKHISPFTVVYKNVVGLDICKIDKMMDLTKDG